MPVSACGAAEPRHERHEDYVLPKAATDGTVIKPALVSALRTPAPEQIPLLEFGKPEAVSS